MSQQLLESINSKPGKIDRDASVIRGVRVLNGKSRNNREYTKTAMDKAVNDGLYEGVDVNVDHPSATNKDIQGNRLIRDSFGVLRDVRRDSNGIVADLHYLKSHPLTESILERAERFPEKFGLSHNAMGKTTNRGGKELVEEIQRVKSVDLVRNPATTTTLFESESVTMTKTLKEILESTADSHKDDQVRKLLVDLTAGEQPLVESKLSVEVLESAEASDQISKATAAALSDLTVKHKQLVESTKQAAADADKKGTSQKTELEKLLESQKQLLESTSQLSKKLLARDLMAEFGVQLSVKDRQLLESQADEAAMRQFIENLPPAARGSRKPLMESVRDATTVGGYRPKTAEEFAKSIR